MARRTYALVQGYVVAPSLAVGCATELAQPCGVSPPRWRSLKGADAPPAGSRLRGTQTCHRRVWGRQETMLYLGVGHSEPSLRAVGSMSPPGDLPRVRVPEAVLASAGRCWRL